MRPYERIGGFTLIEVLVALGIVAVAIAILTSVSVSVLRAGTTTNVRTQSAQMLSYLGRKAAGGSNDVLPASGETLSWDYGDVAAAFPDLVDGAGVSDLARYRASVRSDGAVAYVGASGVRYVIEVCTTAPNGETCIAGVTFGPAPAPAGVTPPLLPGIN